jgi:mannose-6-phosphate isomerase
MIADRPVRSRAVLSRLATVVQPYDWGSPTVLARLQGRPPSGRPEAELWIGAHPVGPSVMVDLDDGPAALDQVIAAEPGPALGDAGVRRFGVRLPFLLKVLAVERALSLQVHPNAAQAVGGYAREVSAAMGPDHPLRCYGDPHPRPELLVALGAVEALAGLRPAHRAAHLLDLVGGARLRRLRTALTTGGLPGGGVADALALLVSWPEPDRRPLVADAVRGAQHALAHTWAADAPDAVAALRWVLRLAGQHRSDPLVLAPLLLSLHRLEPGGSLYVPPGVPHCYLQGVGVEVAAASDNVVRAGLTGKRCDAVELMALLDASAQPLVDQPPEPLSAHEVAWRPPVEEFQLTRARVCTGATLARLAAMTGPQLLLCVGGEVEVGTQDRRVRLVSGEAAFAPAACGPLWASGDGRLFRAGTGRVPSPQSTSGAIRTSRSDLPPAAR